MADAVKYWINYAVSQFRDFRSLDLINRTMKGLGENRSLNQFESDILNNLDGSLLYLINLYAYAGNARRAIDEGQLLFPNIDSDCANCRANSFRHPYLVVSIKG